MTNHSWSSAAPRSASPSIVAVLAATSCSFVVTALRLSRAIVSILRPVLLPVCPCDAASSVPGHAKPLEQQAEQLLEPVIDRAEEEAERSRERHDDGRHVGRLARRGPVDLSDLALQLAEQAHEALPSPAQRQRARARRSDRSHGTSFRWPACGGLVG